ncbi:hypothetical protein [Streptomyces sp. SLBN-31]|uniref:hypothetical protein n=1 Tax=Streptomyces sp. SLBN-31 TaxID=2768444 RepID=UPI0037DA221F
MFVIVMTSIIDLALQNPIMSCGADNAVVRYLPSYGAMQASTAAGFSTSPVPGHLALQLTWFAGAALLSLRGFHRSTRNCLPSTALGLLAGPGRSKAGLPTPRQTATPSPAASDTEAH